MKEEKEERGKVLTAITRLGQDGGVNPDDGAEVNHESEWSDLAANLPGQGARRKAVKLRQAAPIKTVLARLLGVHRDERHWRVGAEGEEEVGWRLRKLGKEWHVIHSVPIGDRGSDIDHRDYRSGWSIHVEYETPPRTKSHGEDVRCLCQRTKRSLREDSRFEAERATRILSDVCNETVQGAAGHRDQGAQLTINSQPLEVSIICRKSIVEWLLRRPAVLTPEQVEIIFEWACRDSTWG